MLFATCLSKDTVFYSFESMIPPAEIANVASFSGRSGLEHKN
jgi:hypothetical protein